MNLINYKNYPIWELRKKNEQIEQSVSELHKLLEQRAKILLSEDDCDRSELEKVMSSIDVLMDDIDFVVQMTCSNEEE